MRPRHKLKDNIKIDLMEIETQAVDWVHLTKNRDGTHGDELPGSTEGG
jgi:hypothetical protein